MISAELTIIRRLSCQGPRVLALASDCLIVAHPNITVPLFRPHKRYIMRVCLIRSSLSAHSSCFVPLHCSHMTLKEVLKHFPYCGSGSSRRSTARDNPTDLFRPLAREGSQSQRGSDAERPRSDERYHSIARVGRYMPEGSPLPFIPSEDSNITDNSPTSFARPVPSSDLTPTELEPTSSLERNKMHGSSNESLGPAFHRVSRAPETYDRTGSALRPVHEQSTDMMLDSRGMIRYVTPTTSLVAPRKPQPYQQGFDATGRPVLHRDCVPISTAVAPDMFREMHSTSDILYEFSYYSVVFLNGARCISRGDRAYRQRSRW
ncbi:hypothetical protein EDD85DRAFT_162086 [Armillaria nabsnona]|nr:hypothetical protein EDD85DRAFT_162086 [Armillaria nabsnona]